MALRAVLHCGVTALLALPSCVRTLDLDEPSEKDAVVGYVGIRSEAGPEVDGASLYRSEDGFEVRLGKLTWFPVRRVSIESQMVSSYSGRNLMEDSIPEESSSIHVIAELHLTAQPRFHSLTAETASADGILGFFAGESLISAPYINSELPGGTVIFPGGRDGYTPAEAAAIVRKIALSTPPPDADIAGRD